MPSKPVIIDTGPLVSIIRSRESTHIQCVHALKQLDAPLLTCWPVITEAAWLLRYEYGGIQAIGKLLRTGAIELVALDARALQWMVAFMERYATLPAQLADAAIMYIAEHYHSDTIFTLDQRDFSIYRTSTGQTLTIIPE